MASQVYDVIVIGCGAAGIAAISRLVQNNVKVLGLEGNNIIGGRILTLPFENSFIDFGAQWCHGEKNNKVYSLIKDLDVVSPPSSHRELVLIKSDGNILTEKQTEEYLKLLKNIHKSIENIKDYKSPSLPQSLDMYLRKTYDEELKKVNFNVNHEHANDILEWYLKSIQTKLSMNQLMDKSFDSVIESWDNEGEQWLNWRDKGYKLFLDILLKKYPDPSKALPVDILLTKEVTNIKWKNLEKSTEDENSFVQVQCKDDSLYAAKHVIVTMSVGVLKLNYTYLFNPYLPEDKEMSIRTLAMCTMNKIYMKFNKKWWPLPQMRFGIVWNESDKEMFADDSDWVYGVYEITTVEYQPDLLCAWIAGRPAQNMELCTLVNVADRMYQLIKHFFGKKFSVQKPEKVFRSTWFTNSMFRGSFSYRSVETECVNKGASVLAEPLLNNNNMPVVCFAGEATSLHHHSTVHGAVESGFREADRLISILKN